MGYDRTMDPQAPPSIVQILFVDDDLEFSWLVVSYVKKRLNVPVRVSNNYEEATKLIGLERFDLIVCGFERPEHSESLFRFTKEHSPSSVFVLFTSNDEFNRHALVDPKFRGRIPKNHIADLVTLIAQETEKITKG